jgi:hypothetical protein
MIQIKVVFSKVTWGAAIYCELTASYHVIVLIYRWWSYCQGYLSRIGYRSRPNSELVLIPDPILYMHVIH